MRNDKIQTIAYMGLYAALFVVLWYVGQFIPFLKMPDGGSIELEFAALFVASFHLGWKKGLVVALISWLLEFMFGGANYFLSPMQYFLDYLCAFAAVALASLFAGHSKFNYYIGMVVSMLLKWLSNVLSGVYFYFPEGSAAGSKAAWVNSVAYNTWYNLATLIVCLILVPVLVKNLKKAKHSVKFAS